MNDPFLGKRLEEGNFSTVPLRDEFLENARLFIFETYCRIHQRIDMGYVPDLYSFNLLYINNHSIPLTILLEGGMCYIPNSLIFMSLNDSNFKILSALSNLFFGTPVQHYHTSFSFCQENLPHEVVW